MEISSQVTTIITLSQDQAKAFNFLMSSEIVDANFYAEQGHSDLFLSEFKKLAAKKFGWEQSYAKEVILSMPSLFDVWDTCEFGVRGDNRFIVNPWSNECLYLIGGQRMADYINAYYNGDVKSFTDGLVKIVDVDGNVILNANATPLPSVESSLKVELTKYINENQSKLDALRAEILELAAKVESAKKLLAGL